MRLSKTTNYAIRILIDCAQAEGELIKVAEISEHQDITPQNAFKIVHLLSRAGFIKATRGRHGGVQLARPATEIRIGDVVRAMEATRVEEGPATKGKKKKGLDRQVSDINQIVDSALNAFVAVLDEHTLEDMAQAKRSKPPARSSQSRAARISDRPMRRADARS